MNVFPSNIPCFHSQLGIIISTLSQSWVTFIRKCFLCSLPTHGTVCVPPWYIVTCCATGCNAPPAPVRHCVIPPPCSSSGTVQTQGYQSTTLSLAASLCCCLLYKDTSFGAKILHVSTLPSVVQDSTSWYTPNEAIKVIQYSQTSYYTVSQNTCLVY